MSSNRKLFHVSMTLDIDMMVLAETVEQARSSGLQNWKTEVSNAALTPGYSCVRQISSRAEASFWGDAEELDNCSPYGVHGEKYENGCSSPQLTIAEYLVQMDPASGGEGLIPSEAAGLVPSEAAGLVPPKAG